MSKLLFLHFYAGTSLSCAGIQWWKSVSFHCWAGINLVGDMSNEEDPTHHPTTPIGHQELRVEVIWAMRRRPPPTPLVIRSWELKWHEQWGGPPPTPPPLVIRSWKFKWYEHWGDPLPHQPHRSSGVESWSDMSNENPRVQLVSYLDLPSVFFFFFFFFSISACSYFAFACDTM